MNEGEFYERIRNMIVQEAMECGISAAKLTGTVAHILLKMVLYLSPEGQEGITAESVCNHIMEQVRLFEEEGEKK
jgi:hypothetical protein